MAATRMCASRTSPVLLLKHQHRVAGIVEKQFLAPPWCWRSVAEQVTEVAITYQPLCRGQIYVVQGAITAGSLNTVGFVHAIIRRLGIEPFVQWRLRRLVPFR